MPECRAEPDDTAEISAKWLALTVDHNLRMRCLAEQERALPQFEGRRSAREFFKSLAD